MKTLFLYIVIIFLFSGSSHLFAQHNNLQQNLNPDSKKVKIQSIIFNDIESGIINNDLKKFSQYFSSQPYLSLVNGVNGYYSSNQAYYILEDFFNSFKVVSFKMEETKTEGTVSYGKGDYYFEKKGRREVAHLYITLNNSGNKWYITQISIN
ncbi:MAG: DUF4783 domain-containing protein [Ignavibacteriaceae bacterium]|jgi:hypothetical protein|nr:DUF4783 domain-containing protein [Ignavibacteriaceae bacterium]